MSTSAADITQPSGAWTLNGIEDLRRFWPSGRFWALSDAPFRALVRRRALPTMLLEGLDATPYGCTGTDPSPTPPARDVMVVSAVVAGSGSVVHEGVAHPVSAGDVLIHGRTAFTYECPVSTRAFRIVLPPRLVADRDRIEDGVFSLVARSTLTVAFVRFAHEVLRSAGREPDLVTRTAQGLEQALLVLLRTLVAELTARGGDQLDRRARLRLLAVQHIERHLRDPDLSPASIAAALKITRRTLFGAWGDDGETVMASVRRRRLEAATQYLLDDRSSSIGDVAARFGYGSADSFTREFRLVHGVAPSVMRGTPRATS